VFRLDVLLYPVQDFKVSGVSDGENVLGFSGTIFSVHGEFCPTFVGHSAGLVCLFIGNTVLRLTSSRLQPNLMLTETTISLITKVASIVASAYNGNTEQ